MNSEPEILKNALLNGIKDPGSDINESTSNADGDDKKRSSFYEASVVWSKTGGFYNQSSNSNADLSLFSKNEIGFTGSPLEP